LIVKLVRAYHATYAYSLEQARWGVQVMRQDGLVGNGGNRSLGDFDLGRLQRMLTVLLPVYATEHKPLRHPPTPAQLATDEFLDPAIGLPAN